MPHFLSAIGPTWGLWDIGAEPELKYSPRFPRVRWVTLTSQPDSHLSSLCGQPITSWGVRLNIAARSKEEHSFLFYFHIFWFRKEKRKKLKAVELILNDKRTFMFFMWRLIKLNLQEEKWKKFKKMTETLQPFNNKTHENLLFGRKHRNKPSSAAVTLILLCLQILLKYI